MKQEMVLIPRSKFIEILKESFYFNALANGGVDNWQWYGESISDYVEQIKFIYGEEYQNCETLDDIVDILINEYPKANFEYIER